jgi:hypothetical protein
MNFYHISLLLLVVLSAYSESPQHAKPPDSPHCTGVTICLNSSSAQLGVLAPVLPQVEVYMFTQPNEVYMSIQPQNEVYRIALPPNEVYMFTQPPNEVYMSTQPQNEVYRIALPPNEVFRIVLLQNGVFLLSQKEVLKSVPANCQMFCNFKTCGSGPLLCMARVLVPLWKLQMLILTIILLAEYYTLKKPR